MTADDIRQLIKTGKLESEAVSIEQGYLEHSSGHTSPYSIEHGWDIASSMECDSCWGKANIELFEHIEKQNLSDAELKKVLDSIQTEDAHWSWFNKSAAYAGDEYEWFYLYAENLPQAACLIYHPKDSAIDDSKIFYVEFLAVAPWNRTCLIREREYMKVGSTLLKASLRYSVEELGLSPGFSLHSLPQASGYYSKLSMVNVAKFDKGSLLYFELPGTEANKLLEAT